jgi:hypothetical protein
MTREPIIFSGTDKKLIDHQIEVRPAEKGWNLFIDGLVRFGGTAFNNFDIKSRFYYMKCNGYTFEATSSNEWLLSAHDPAGGSTGKPTQGIKANARGRKNATKEDEEEETE